MFWHFINYLDLHLLLVLHVTCKELQTCARILKCKESEKHGQSIPVQLIL